MIVKCSICTNELYINPAAYAAGKGRFCSRYCHHVFQKGRPQFRKTMTPMDHFSTKIKKTSGCWLWAGTIDNNGYGKFEVTIERFVRRVFSSHRFSYELYKGPIPAGLHIDHLCRVRNCVNPEHLEVVTPRENVLRGIGLSAINSKKTHCKNGHEFTPGNTRIKKGSRICISCARESDRKLYRKNVKTDAANVRRFITSINQRG